MSASIWNTANDRRLYAGTLTLSGLDSAGNLTAPIITDSNHLCSNLYVARALVADNFSGNITGNSTLNGYLNITANVDIGTDLQVDGTIHADGNINTDSNLNVDGDALISGDITAGNITATYQFISTTTTLPPLVVNSNLLVANLYAARAAVADNFSGNITANSTIQGWLATTANLSVGTDLSVGDDLSVGGNIDATGWIHSDANISAGTDLTVGGDAIITGDLQASNITATYQFISTTTDKPPFIINSSDEVANLNSEFAGTADIALALKSATTTVNVSAAAAPMAGQVLTATNGTTAIWQDATSPSGNLNVNNVTADVVTANSLVLNGDASISGNLDVNGWINSDANISAGTDIVAGGDLRGNDLILSGYAQIGANASVGTNLAVTGAITNATNITATGTIQGSKFTSTVATGTAPFTVSSTTEVANLKAATATAALGLKSATTTVSVSGATAPSSGQVLTATGSSTATWQTPASAVTSAAQTNYVSALGERTDATYGDLTAGDTTVQSITMTTNTLVLIVISCELTNVTAGSNAKMAVEISGATTQAASARYQIEFKPPVGGGFDQFGASYVATLTAGSNTFTLKFASSNTNKGQFKNRIISIIPLN